MKKMLIDLFQDVAWNVKYKTIGLDVNYAFIEKEDTLYIFFQGSSSVADWIENFAFKQKVYGEFKVHRGFLFAYKQVRDLLLDQTYSNNYKQVIVVGYSHGGALCQLAFEDIKYHFPELEVKGYAFESPRCLKVPKKYRHRWNGLTVIRNGTDIVTHLPPRIFGFDDLGIMLKIKGNPKLVGKRLPKFIKYHYPIVVLDGLNKIKSGH